MPHDPLARAFYAKTLRRSFQGYTDDRTPYLIGLGASAISTYPQGFAQNVPVTGQYAEKIDTGLPVTWRGYALSARDRLKADLIEQLMCYHVAELSAAQRSDPALMADIDRVSVDFSGAIAWDGHTLSIRRWAHPLVRVIAVQLVTPSAAASGARTYSAAI